MIAHAFRFRTPFVALLITVLASGCSGGPSPVPTTAPSAGPSAARGATPAALEPATLRAPLIPTPRTLVPGEGVFAFGPGTRVLIPIGAPETLRTSVEVFLAPLRRMTGFDLDVVEGPAAVAAQALDVLDLRIVPDAGATGTAAEAYLLEARPERITLSAPTEAGLFRGLMTLRRLLPPEYERGVRAEAPWGQIGGPAPAPEVVWSVPAVRIEDEPRFVWRGMHLDVGRHFFPVDFVKKYIDLIALHGMNSFHWHLTEDQGWRIEIEGWPRLTEIGGCRPETMVAKNFDPFVGDETEYCGFYTQEEIREVVAYAAARQVNVVPEIEMPGHSLAALAAYPEFACTEGPFEVGTRWGVYDDIYCPKEETFAFLEEVLSQVMELFPSEFIHIGGDEAPKTRWEESEVAQAVIDREGLADEHELQSWFVARIERFLNANGRRLIGWDEILEGGLAPNATVMSWRGDAGGIAAARQGHDAVMSPASHVYFDHWQADPEIHDEPLAICCLSTLERVWSWEPVPAELTADEARHILGGQANIWTEYMKTPNHVEYMALPRMAALAEVLWSPASERATPADWRDFMHRLEVHLRRLDEFGVRYRALDGG